MDSIQNKTVQFIDNEYNKMLGMVGLTGVVTKVIHKNTGDTYNVKCSDDTLCCVPITCVEVIE